MAQTRALALLLVAGMLGLATANQVCFDEQPVTQAQTNLSAVVGCMRNLEELIRADNETTVTGLVDRLQLNASRPVVINLPENTKIEDGIPTFCRVFVVDVEGNKGETLWPEARWWPQ